MIMNPREKIFPALIFLIILANLLTSIQSDCRNNGNYTANSTYSANLKTALSSLSTRVDINGFYNTSVGQIPDRVNAAVLCQGDIQLDECRACAQNATADLLESCPNYKQANGWDENMHCLIRYSNETIFGKVETDTPPICWHYSETATDKGEFRQKVRALLDELRGKAAHSSSVRKVAWGNVTGPRSVTIYGIVQCFPDLSPEDCNNCLVRVTEDIQSCEIDDSVGSKVGRGSCFLEYETYPFVNETRLQELAPPSPPPAPAPAGVLIPSHRPPILTPPPGPDSHKTKIVIIIVVTTVVCLALVGCGIIFLGKRIKQRRYEIPGSEDIGTSEFLQYDFDKIRVATNDFSNTNKLGHGGFGVVYKGKLQNGQEIAVKRLSTNSRQGNVEFKNEVLLLLKLQHKNLVKLLGFSIQRTERLLIYEFVPNSSLDKFIFDRSKRSYLDWNRSYKIIAGIAKGLVYLHEDSRLKIIHRDLKASNILLDSEMNPKIADFGMARLFGQNESEGNTDRIVGTYGYMSPEYAMHGQFSSKSDVFSFGVLILEILTGRKSNYAQNEENMENLLSFVWKNWSQGKAVDIIDPILRANKDSVQDMLRCAHMGLLCVQENAAERPTMPLIALMLSSSTVTLPLPKEPAFCGNSLFGPISGKTTTDMYEDSSTNSMTITDIFQPR